jgi:hypothetical protein
MSSRSRVGYSLGKKIRSRAAEAARYIISNKDKQRKRSRSRVPGKRWGCHGSRVVYFYIKTKTSTAVAAGYLLYLIPKKSLAPTAYSLRQPKAQQQQGTL